LAAAAAVDLLKNRFPSHGATEIFSVRAGCVELSGKGVILLNKITPQQGSSTH